jgi:TRAP-type C4-dicarboxylate transport system substrate-binding protein
MNPVPLETADVVPGFTTGLIEAIPMPPFAVLGAQIDSKARHMLELNWAPLVGALVITKKAWDKIPDGAKEALRAAAVEAGRENKAAGRADSEESVKRMKQRGLIVHEITPEIEAEWRKAVESANHLIRGKIVPADIYDEAERLIKEYREKNPSGK